MSQGKISHLPILSLVKKFSSVNNKVLRVFTDESDYFVPLNDIYRALGFSGNFAIDTTLAIPFRQNFFVCFKKRLSNASGAYLCKLYDVVPLLKNFIELVETRKLPYNCNLTKQDAIVNAQNIITQLKQEILPDPDLPLKINVFGEDKPIDNEAPPVNDTRAEQQNSSTANRNYYAYADEIEQTLRIYLSPSELWDDLDELAEAEGISVGQMTLELIEVFVEANQKLLESYRDFVNRPLVMPRFEEKK